MKIIYGVLEKDDKKEVNPLIQEEEKANYKISEIPKE